MSGQRQDAAVGRKTAGATTFQNGASATSASMMWWMAMVSGEIG
jgi:hypothetical protein